MNHFEKFNSWILDIHNNGGTEYIKSQSPFTMTIVAENGVPVGVDVTNLGNDSYLPISVFHATLFLLQAQGGKALKGKAREFRLGEGDLPTNSVDGYIASTIYNKDKGIAVTARITPVSGILEEAGVCTSNRDGYLHLV